MLAATDDFSNLGLEQVDHHDPSRTKNMDMSWVMIARVDHHAPAIDAQDGRHHLSYHNPSGREEVSLVQQDHTRSLRSMSGCRQVAEDHPPVRPQAAYRSSLSS